VDTSAVRSNGDAPATARRKLGVVIWLTGLSGAGKSTLALALKRDFDGRGIQAVSVDGDQLRRGLCYDLGFGKEARSENVRRAAEIAVLVARAGMACIVAMISPYEEDRARARAIATRDAVPFLEVFVDAPLSVCEERDPKGLYRLARAGELLCFTGVSDPYEVPSAPDVHVRTDLQDPAVCASRIAARAVVAFQM
jgi:adenylyl-sulfate kinase